MTEEINENIDIVVNQENELQFKKFNNDIALKLAQEIVASVKKNKLKPIGIQIVYQDRVILYYLMDGKRESDWLQRKIKTVKDSGHSSLFVYYLSERESKFKNWKEINEYAVCGGGFPIIENGVVVGAIAVSGLEHVDDHSVIAHAIEQIKMKNEGK